MKFKVLEFTRKPKKGVEKFPYFDTLIATIEITEQSYFWFVKPKVATIQVYKPHANWKHADTGAFCDRAINDFLNAYEELNEL